MVFPTPSSLYYEVPEVFGKTQRGVSERPNKPKNALVPSWLWMLVGVLLALSVAVWLMLWKPWEPVQPKNQVTSEHYQEDSNKDYRFYDLLPKQQVTPIPEQAVPANTPSGTVVIVAAPEQAEPAPKNADNDSIAPDIVAPKASFILQIRSYDDPDSADARRAEIILNGLAADVVEINENGRIWYRVISGPYESQEAAILAQQTLQNSGIDSIVVKH